MFDTLEAVRGQLLAGEDAFAEFKEVRLGERSVISPNSEDFAGEIVAFANAEGGLVFLGVDDAGVVRGIPDGSLGIVEGWVINIATNNCDPPIRPLVRKVRLPDQAGSDVGILLVEVRASLFVHRTAGGRYYVRVGSTKRDLTSQELLRLAQQRGRAFIFDEQPVMTATEADLDRKALERFFGRPSTVAWPELLRNTRIVVTDEGGLERPTVAALLAFGASPLELPSAYIAAAVYRRQSLTSDDLVHSETISDSVPSQIDEAVAFVERFMLRPSRKPAGREDYPQYAIGAVHEAIVNAVAHRDYSISGSKIRLFLFADRLELYSPGALPNTITLENMPFRVFTRNQLLVNFLSKMTSRKTGRAFLESRGEGVRRILEESERHSGRRPEYRLLGEELLLTVWAKPSPHDAASEEGSGV